MIDRNGNKHCGWCGETMRASAKSQCCSSECARAYAKDRGRPNRWRSYAPGHRCEKCGGEKANPVYAWCQGCLAVRRERAEAGQIIPPATQRWLNGGAR